MADDRDEAGRFQPGHDLGGRAGVYDDEMADIAFEVMSRGLSKTAAAGVLGIARSTFALWEQDHPRFSEAVKRGEAARTLHLEQDLLEAPDGPTVTSRIFALKNAAPDEWRDKVVNEHTGKDGEDIKVAAQIDYTQLSTAALKELEGVLAKDDPSADNGRSAADQE